MSHLSPEEHRALIQRIVDGFKPNNKWLVYLAGPYTYPSPVLCTGLAIKKADELMAKHPSWIIFIPHLSLLWDLHTHHDPEFWYNYDLHILERCDMLYRMSGFSPGADGEVELALKLGKKVIIEGGNEKN